MHSSDDKKRRPATLKELEDKLTEINNAKKDPRDPKGFYKIFGLSPDAKLDAQRLGEEFKKLRFQYHPDKQAGKEIEGRKAEELFQILGEAHAALRNEASRRILVPL